MSDIKEGAVSKQKASYVSHSVGKRGKGDYLELTYKRLDGENPGTEMKAGAFITQLDDASKERIKAKGEFVVVKTKQGNFWNLTRIDDVSTYTPKTNTYTKGNSNYNTAGIKVGAVLHDAVALAGTGATTAKVKALAEELLTLSFQLEEDVAAGKYTTKKSLNVTETSTSSDSTGDLSNINF